MDSVRSHSANWRVTVRRVRTTDPLAPKRSPIRARAKNVIFLFMAGAPSHLELFDYKPQLAKFDGTLPPAELLKGYRAAFINPNSKLLGPKFKFAKYGQCGAELSELLPHLAEVVDDIAIVKSMVTDAFNHAPGQILMSTGSQQFGKPSLGAWTLYGLGSETQNLPGFVVFSTGKKGPSGGNSNWGSGYLPTVYQGVTFRTSGDPVLYLSNPPGVDRQLQRDSLDAVNALNRLHLAEMGDPEIATRINSFEMAYRMQAEAPDAIDISKEPRARFEDVRGRAGQAFVRGHLFACTQVSRTRRAVRGDFSRSVGSARQSYARYQRELRHIPTRPARPSSRTSNSAACWMRRWSCGAASSAARRWCRGAATTAATTIRIVSACGSPAAALSRALRSARATTSVSMQPKAAFTFTTCTPRSCTCWVSTRRGLSFKFQGLDQRLIGVQPARVVDEILA